jgi:hypothetical protein
MADERTLVADIKSYIDGLPGFSSEVEEHVTAGLKRSDLLVRYNGKLLFNGEFKRPTVIEGRNPRAADLVDDAYLKSQKLSSPTRFFITSNFNETVIWDNRDTQRPLMSRDISTIELPIKIKEDNDFNRNDIKEAIKKIFQELTRKILDYYENKITAEYLPLGDSFIAGLNSHLNAAVDMAYKYVKDSVLKKWWAEQQYEPVSKFTEVEKRRISRFSLYVLSNKILFYYVLRRSFKELSEINIDENEEDILVISKIINGRFDEAKKVSGDYETVFEDSEVDKIPFSSNELSHDIKSLVLFFKLYNFSNLSQDILGNIYDTLISPKERHQNGQYFTPIPVVDLINAFTIRNADAIVMDPACGSGTFLTKAFDFKSYLAQKDDKKTREKFVKEIFGVDIASYPVHLATVALASKMTLANPKVYPQIVKSDFLDIEPNKQNVLSLHEHTIKGLNKKTVNVKIKEVDAVVGNLPYIRQEEIPNKSKEQEKVKNVLERHGFKPEIPNNTSDFHAYFWYYILPFLKEGSRVGFLTSDTWLNVNYGDDLKRFINKYFKIVAIIDSSVERYFPDALVNTVITILERTDDKEIIKNNKIKFVRINKKLSQLIDVNSNDVKAAINIAKKIEDGQSTSDVTIIREVRQGDIDFNDTLKSKMFPYLRAPEEFFELVNSKNMIPLNKVMGIQRGFTTGANEFFYVEDVTSSYSEDQLKKRYGLNKGDIKTLRVVKDGTGQEHVIEAKYLKPILKSPKEFTAYGSLNFQKPTKKYVVLIEEKKKSEVEKYAREYLEYGEKQQYNLRPTCKSRPQWWRLSPIIYPDLIFSMNFSSSFLYPKSNYLLDNRLYFGILNKGFENELIGVYSFLNSSLSYLYPDFYGDNNLGGGAVGFTVDRTKLLPVPKIEILRPSYNKIRQILDSIEKRKIGSVFEEIWNGKGKFDLSNVKKDRLELDKLILKLLGINNIDNFLENWYISVVKTVNGRLDKAASLKTRKESSKGSLSTIANEIVSNIKLKMFPVDYVVSKKDYIKIELGSNIKKGKDLKGFFVSIDGNKLYYDNAELAEYIYYCAILGVEDIPIPADIKPILNEFKDDLKKISNELKSRINNISDNEKYQEKLYNVCVEKLSLSQIINN